MESASIQANIAHHLPELAVRQPGRSAVLEPDGGFRSRTLYREYTFLELERRCNAFAWGLAGTGIRPGMRVLLMVKPGRDLFALTFALFKIGAIPVMIDPGMGWKGFFRAVAQVEPEGFIGIPAAHLLRLFHRQACRSIQVSITWGRRLFWGGQSLGELLAQAQRQHGGTPYPVSPQRPDDPAAILFTSGSTGPAKGVVYTHGIFNAQVEILRREYGISGDDTDLPCFPLFGLFSMALGARVVIPKINFSFPAQADPRRIVEPIRRHRATYSFGSPALWSRVAAHCLEHKIQLPSLRRILVAGAPVPFRLHEQLLGGGILPAGAEIFTPYGATESLPVANMRGTEVLAETAAATREGRGICVGRPLPEIRLKVIRISDTPIPAWDPSLELPDGEIGEICVQGPVVTREYFRLPEATAAAKIQDGDGFWHRIGDVGYRDAQGRIWFCGRKGHRVETAAGPLFSVCCEAIPNQHPRVFRSALVGTGPMGKQNPAIVIEPRPGDYPNGASQEESFRQEILGLLAASPLTREIKTVLFYRHFPVDIRHNAKINREQLAAWAAAR